jgi:hypothetical protein
MLRLYQLAMSCLAVGRRLFAIMHAMVSDDALTIARGRRYESGNNLRRTPAMAPGL